jgi:hypothetical protein
MWFQGEISGHQDKLMATVVGSHRRPTYPAACFAAQSPALGQFNRGRKMAKHCLSGVQPFMVMLPKWAGGVPKAVG